MAKPKIGLYWCASCGGCEEAVVDLAEDILKVVAAVDIAFWPVALDFKKTDLEAIPDGGLAVGFVNGGVRSSEQEEMAKLMRRKSALLVAFGSCAQTGGIPGLINLYDKEEMLRRVYEEVPSMQNPGKDRPKTAHHEGGHELELPELHDAVKPLDEVVGVDYYLPGCPPTPKVIFAAITAILEGKLPPKGSILSPDVALCKECPLSDSKPEKLEIAEFKRPHQVLIDPQKCLLAQGLLCLGPATRGGCEAQCIGAAMPCTGCFGPTSEVVDFGAKAMTAVASLGAQKDEEGIEKLIDGIPDPVGTFYRYSLPASRLAGRVPKERAS